MSIRDMKQQMMLLIKKATLTVALEAAHEPWPPADSSVANLETEGAKCHSTGWKGIFAKSFTPVSKQFAHPALVRRLITDRIPHVDPIINDINIRVESRSNFIIIPRHLPHPML